MADVLKVKPPEKAKKRGTNKTRDTSANNASAR
jgi:hypothetical protein